MAFAPVYAGAALPEKRNDYDMVKIALPPVVPIIVVTLSQQVVRHFASWRDGGAMLKLMEERVVSVYVWSRPWISPSHALGIPTSSASPSRQWASRSSPP